MTFSDFEEQTTSSLIRTILLHTVKIIATFDYHRNSKERERERGLVERIGEELSTVTSSMCILRYYLLYFLAFLLWIECQSSSFMFSHPSFLKSTYPVKAEVSKKFCVRQVPGDGACLFHSIAVWISYIRYGKHFRFDWRMRSLSNTLRQLAVEMLRTNQSFYVESNETITSTELLAYISDYHNTTAKDYLDKMMKAREWGGGPEIIALCNHFQCPIHVYELSTQGLFPKEFCLQICAKFGSPIFDDKLPICILHADGR